MKRTSLHRFLLPIGLFALLTSATLPTASHAQNAFRGWVSRSGSDANDCAINAPCRTFAKAVANSRAHGEINCLDSGPFLPVTIDRPVTIDCDGTLAAIDFNSNHGIIVLAGVSDKVIIRGLHLNTTETASTWDGIRFLSGGELEVDKVTISGGSPNTAGINIALSAIGVASIRNSTFSKMAVGIRTFDTRPNVVVSITNCSFNNLSNTGIEVGNESYVSVGNSVFSAVLGYGINIKGGTATAYVSDNLFSNNYFAVNAPVAGARLSAANNKMFGSARAFNVAAGVSFLSGNNNQIDVNPGSSPTGPLTVR